MDNRRRVVMTVAAIVAIILILLPLPHVKNGTKNAAIVSAQTQPTQSNTNSDTQSNTVVEHKTVTVRYYDVPLSHSLQDYIRDLCVQYNVNEQLAYAVIKTESSFDPNVTSDAGAIGLCQINPINFDYLHEKLGVSNLYNPFQNVECGIYMLGQLKQKYDTENEELIAYNNGESAADRLISRGTTETNYTDKVEYEKGQLQEVFVEMNVKGE